ncbi:unnamed protein product [Coffea canephora]|uniref:DH200=94 genomic scaffold, scaffold_2174 n=2 Tax=Coffea TaxID=13442 RepID=A0A068VJF9_COFCA|nr:aluminum-activated malate transporter 10-like [Coffea arabica]CDP20970.1 unnamed protein product [Coffea canephora]
MTNIKEDAGRVEWRIRVDEKDGSSDQVLETEPGPANGFCRVFKCLVANKFSMRLLRFLKKAWHLGVDDPRKVFHCLKVGIALSVVSLFYYMRPLYDGVGGTAMWAVMTVVVVFENTVGATISKSLNRAIGTCLAGLLAVGIHWVASKSGNKLEPVIVEGSLFLLASAATFSRFVPAVKKKFDYGTVIFILTFSLVSVSGYRVEKLFDMAKQRLSTIIIGTSLCILTSMLVSPIWAGQELHCLIIKNMEKLATSLECCVAEYFDDGQKTTSAPVQNLQAYKCVLNSKATEESMANFAAWEPAHGSFNFQHPWKQYLKIAAAMRDCAYCIEALNSCISNKKQASKSMKKHLSDICLKVNSSSGSILRELAINLETFKKTSKMDISIEEMNNSVQEVKNYLKSLPGLVLTPTTSETKSSETAIMEPLLTTNTIPLVEVIPLVTFTSLLIEIPTRVEAIVDAVEELANKAKFKPAPDDKPKQNEQNNKTVSEQLNDEKTMKTLQSV